jgi:hypothetical protein
MNTRSSAVALFAASLVTITFLVLPATGAAATPTDRKIAALQRQVKALQKQVKTIQTRLNVVRIEQTLAFAAATCDTAMTADLLQGTWGVIDQIAQAAQGRTYFGPQQQLNDFRNCSFLGNPPSVPRPALASPPSIFILNPLLTWLHVE